MTCDDLRCLKIDNLPSPAYTYLYGLRQKKRCWHFSLCAYTSNSNSQGMPKVLNSPIVFFKIISTEFEYRQIESSVRVTAQLVSKLLGIRTASESSTRRGALTSNASTPSRALTTMMLLYRQVALSTRRTRRDRTMHSRSR